MLAKRYRERMIALNWMFMQDRETEKWILVVVLYVCETRNIQTMYQKLFQKKITEDDTDVFILNRRMCSPVAHQITLIMADCQRTDEVRQGNKFLPQFNSSAKGDLRAKVASDIIQYSKDMITYVNNISKGH